jgi:hypothetical protein
MKSAEKWLRKFELPNSAKLSVAWSSARRNALTRAKLKFSNKVYNRCQRQNVYGTGAFV